MPLAFPSDPELNDEYTLGGRTWKFFGNGWILNRDVEIIGSIYSQIRPISPGILVYRVGGPAGNLPVIPNGVTYL